MENKTYSFNSVKWVISPEVELVHPYVAKRLVKEGGVCVTDLFTNEKYYLKREHDLIRIFSLKYESRDFQLYSGFDLYAHGIMSPKKLNETFSALPTYNKNTGRYAFITKLNEVAEAIEMEFDDLISFAKAVKTTRYFNIYEADSE